MKRTSIIAASGFVATLAVMGSVAYAGSHAVTTDTNSDAVELQQFVDSNPQLTQAIAALETQTGGKVTDAEFEDDMGDGTTHVEFEVTLADGTEADYILNVADGTTSVEVDDANDNDDDDDDDADDAADMAEDKAEAAAAGN